MERTSSMLLGHRPRWTQTQGQGSSGHGWGGHYRARPSVEARRGTQSHQLHCVRTGRCRGLLPGRGLPLAPSAWPCSHKGPQGPAILLSLPHPACPSPRHSPSHFTRHVLENEIQRTNKKMEKRHVCCLLLVSGSPQSSVPRGRHDHPTPWTAMGPSALSPVGPGPEQKPLLTSMQPGVWSCRD